MSVGNPLGNPLGNPFGLDRAAGGNSAPDLVLRRTSGTDVITIPDGYKSRRVTLIAPGGGGGGSSGPKGGDSGQAGGSAQTYRAPISDKQVSFSINYQALAGISTASLDGISLTATHGSISGQALAGGATITTGKGIAFTGPAGATGQTGVSATVRGDGASSAVPGITGYGLGGSGVGGGGNGTYFGSAGLEQEGALPATPGTSSAVGTYNDVPIAGGQRQGSLGGVVVELWRN